MNKLACFFLFSVFLFIPTSCGLFDGIEQEFRQLREQSVLALNDGINSIQNESADWQFILNELSEKIDKRVQDILTYNIPYILNLASQRALSTVLCIKENIKDEVVYYLQVARAELITGVLPPLPATKICLTSLLTIDLNAPRNIRNQIIYTGYYIHTRDSIQAYLVKGTVKVKIPASNLGFPDISNITLSLANYSDATLSNYTHVNLYYNEDVISSIGIDKVVVTPPAPKTVQTNAKTMVWIPPHTYGDREYSGHGPKMIAHVYLKHDGLKVFAQIYLWAQETQSDWTTADGWSQWVEIYTAPANHRINRIKDPTAYGNILRSTSGVDYVDTNHEDHIIETAVGRATLVGDTSGSEAGSKTKITLNLKTFTVEIQQN